MSAPAICAGLNRAASGWRLCQPVALPPVVPSRQRDCGLMTNKANEATRAHHMEVGRHGNS